MPKFNKKKAARAVSQAPLRGIRKAVVSEVKRMVGPQPRRQGDMAVASFRRRQRQRGSNNDAASIEMKVSQPVAQQVSYVSGAPQFNGSRPIVVRHREYLQPIMSVTSFTGANPYILQPGLADNFPWLAQLAQGFEQYKFKMLRFLYRNRASTSVTGAIYTAVQYDPSDVPFTSIEQLMTYAGARSEVVWKDCAIDCFLNRSDFIKKFFVRTDTLPSGLDPQTFDSGLFTICAVTSTAGTYLGDLLVEYEVELYNPKQNPAILGAFGLGGYMDGDYKQLTSKPFNGWNASSVGNFNEAALPVLNETTGVITFPVPGAYDVSWQQIFDVGVSAIPVAVASAGAILSVNFNTGTTPTASTLWAKLITTAVAQTLTLSNTATTGTSGGFSGTLAIACEAIDWMLEYLSLSPTPPLIDSDAELYLRTRSKHSRGAERLLKVHSHRYVLPRVVRDVEMVDVEPPERSQSRDAARSRSKHEYKR
jgi:hypothetical protein